MLITQLKDMPKCIIGEGSRTLIGELIEETKQPIVETEKVRCTTPCTAPAYLNCDMTEPKAWRNCVTLRFDKRQSNRPTYGWGGDDM